MPLPTNHWAREPADGWHHDPLRSRNFPKYDTGDREEGIGRYWDEYYARVDGSTKRRHSTWTPIASTFALLALGGTWVLGASFFDRATLFL